MLNKRIEQNKNFISKTICSSLIEIQIKSVNRKGIKKPYVGSIYREHNSNYIYKFPDYSFVCLKN